MENNFKQLLERDAAPLTPESTEIVEISTESLADNNMVLANQTNSSSVIRFDNCNGVTLGSIFNIGLPTRNNVVAQPNKGALEMLRDEPYGKTPTIKEMMKSTELISPAFLDILSGFFGARWKEAMILLQINQLFVERMVEDYSERGGVKEIIFQILSQHFKENEEHAKVGWIITFLWRNGFKKTVWSVREPWKNLKKLEKDLEN